VDDDVSRHFMETMEISKGLSFVSFLEFLNNWKRYQLDSGTILRIKDYSWKYQNLN
jgi:hypothetical protein